MSSYFNLCGSASAKVSPLVVAAAMDAYQRRPTGTSRAIGGLLGRISGNNIEITDCFSVPISDTDGVIAIDKDHYKQSVQLMKKVSKDNIIGWFATGEKIEDELAGLQLFFSNIQESRFYPTSLLPSPLLLIADPTREEHGFNMRAFMSSLTTGADTLMQFHRIPTDVMVTNDWADALGALAGHSQVIGSKAAEQKHEYSSRELIHDLQQAKSVPVNQETLSEVLACIQLAEAAEKQLIASLMN